MASRLEENITACEECGYPVSLRYRVNKNLCDTCYQQHHQDILSREKEDENWMCSYHDKETVGCFCRTCRCGICLQCVRENMHEGHEIVPVNRAEEQTQKRLDEALQKIDDETKRALSSKIRLEKCNKLIEETFTNALADVRQEAANMFEDIDRTLDAETEAVNKEFLKEFQQLREKRDTALRAAARKTLEERRKNDTTTEAFVSSLKKRRKSVEGTLNYASTATMLHEKKDTLEQHQIALESLKDSKGKQLLIRGEEALASLKKRVSSFAEFDIDMKIKEACTTIHDNKPPLSKNWKDKFTQGQNKKPKETKETWTYYCLKWFVFYVYCTFVLFSGEMHDLHNVVISLFGDVHPVVSNHFATRRYKLYSDFTFLCLSFCLSHTDARLVFQLPALTTLVDTEHSKWRQWCSYYVFRRCFDIILGLFRVIIKQYFFYLLAGFWLRMNFVYCILLPTVVVVFLFGFFILLLLALFFNCTLQPFFPSFFPPDYNAK